jgi:SpoVK/Ycf46/Vps4 family AAA+-type ATPase
MKELAEKYLT